ncbi:hypothetical protein B2J93_9076 [Marssonina coronariae]|uniref:Uncharacterized protein n=1 Tax=Diplocarpon coronariae TaxID=2795749 RepID=A0A218YSX3_9HELO|nr:hypothetical protein B2J93_9076 [Marssonina coronariae]
MKFMVGLAEGGVLVRGVAVAVSIETEAILPLALRALHSRTTAARCRRNIGGASAGFSGGSCRRGEGGVIWRDANLTALGGQSVVEFLRRAGQGGVGGSRLCLVVVRWDTPPPQTPNHLLPGPEDGGFVMKSCERQRPNVLSSPPQLQLPHRSPPGHTAEDSDPPLLTTPYRTPLLTVPVALSPAAARGGREQAISSMATLPRPSHAGELWLGWVEGGLLGGLGPDVPSFPRPRSQDFPADVQGGRGIIDGLMNVVWRAGRARDYRWSDGCGLASELPSPPEGRRVGRIEGVDRLVARGSLSARAAIPDSPRLSQREQRGDERDLSPSKFPHSVPLRLSTKHVRDRVQKKMLPDPANLAPRSWPPRSRGGVGKYKSNVPCLRSHARQSISDERPRPQGPPIHHAWACADEDCGDPRSAIGMHGNEAEENAHRPPGPPRARTQAAVQTEHRRVVTFRDGLPSAPHRRRRVLRWPAPAEPLRGSSSRVGARGVPGDGGRRCRRAGVLSGAVMLRRPGGLPRAGGDSHRSSSRRLLSEAVWREPNDQHTNTHGPLLAADGRGRGSSSHPVQTGSGVWHAPWVRTASCLCSFLLYGNTGARGDAETRRERRWCQQ